MHKQIVKVIFFVLIFPLALFCDDFDVAVDGYKKGDYQIALELFDKSCSEGNRQGCYNLAVMYKNGQGIRPSRQKAEELFAIACQNDLKECRFNDLNKKS